jgi:hypothetical protein
MSNSSRDSDVGIDALDWTSAPPEGLTTRPKEPSSSKWLGLCICSRWPLVPGHVPPPFAKGLFTFDSTTICRLSLQRLGLE